MMMRFLSSRDHSLDHSLCEVGLLTLTGSVLSRVYSVCVTLERAFADILLGGEHIDLLGSLSFGCFFLRKLDLFLVGLKKNGIAARFSVVSLTYTAAKL